MALTCSLFKAPSLAYVLSLELANPPSSCLQTQTGQNYRIGYCCVKSMNTPYSPLKIFEPRHEISNNVVCATSKASDQPGHTHSLIRAFACHLNIL